jgi:hypothetical protein
MQPTAPLDEKVVEQRGPWQLVRRWWKGVHPDKGTIVFGWSGWETVEEFLRFRPAHVVHVTVVSQAA